MIDLKTNQIQIKIQIISYFIYFSLNPNNLVIIRIIHVCPATVHGVKHP